MDDLKKAIQSHKPSIDAAINDFCDKTRVAVRKDYGDEFAGVFDTLLEILERGGKRFRGVLTIYAYRLFGGKDAVIAAKAATIIEMIQTHLLVIDDVADQSDTRRGGPSCHKLLEKFHIDNHLVGDTKFYAEVQTVNLGLAAQSLAFSMIDTLEVSSEIKARAHALLHKCLTNTNIGQTLDIENEQRRINDESKTLQMMRLKTAYYSFAMPLKFGATLAGASNNSLKFLTEYSKNAGLAFQLKDDLLSTIDDTAHADKNPRDDLAGGKWTVLVTYALRNGSPDQVAKIHAVLGNRTMTDEQFVAARQALIDSGAVNHSHRLITKYADAAVTALEKAPANLQSKLDLLKKIIGR